MEMTSGTPLESGRADYSHRTLLFLVFGGNFWLDVEDNLLFKNLRHFRPVLWHLTVALEMFPASYRVENHSDWTPFQDGKLFFFRHV